VDIAAHVDRTGYVCHVLIVQSSGLPEIDRAVLDAASDWRWRPAEKQAQPVESIEIERASFAAETQTACRFTKRVDADLTKAVVRK